MSEPNPDPSVLTVRQLSILRWILARENFKVPATSVDVGNFFPVDDPFYGRQRDASKQIAHLRRLGLLVDVPRCPHCNRAQSRGRRRVPLLVTEKGRSIVGAAIAMSMFYRRVAEANEQLPTIEQCGYEDHFGRCRLGFGHDGPHFPDKE